MIGHRVVLRPRSVLETGDLTAAFVRAHWRLFARLLPWTVVPAIGAYLAHALGDWTSEGAVLLFLASTAITSGVYTVLCGDLMLRPETSLKDVQKRYLSAVLGFVWARIVSGIVCLVTIGFGYGYAAFIPEAVLLERGRAGAAMTRSNALLGSTPGRAFGWLFATALLLAVGGVGGELFYRALRGLFGLSIQMPDPDHLSFAPFFGTALILPYVSAMRFLLYIDCRTRREGWDLQVQMSALVQSATSHLRSPPKEAA